MSDMCCSSRFWARITCVCVSKKSTNGKWHDEVAYGELYWISLDFMLQIESFHTGG